MNATTPRRSRGEGSVYRKPGSVYWWLGYSANGKRVQESAGTKKRKEALDVLRDRLHSVAAGTYTGPERERVTFEDVAARLRNQYKLDGLRSLKRAEQALTRLSAHFGGWKARAITTDAVKAYHAERLEASAAQATVHYEIAILKHALRVAGAGRLEYRLGTVDNARQGFFERADFEAVRAELPAPLRPVITFAYLTGWRKREILGLRWRDVDLAAGMVRLEPGTTKNGKGRTFAFGALPELAELLKAQREATSAVERATGAIVPWVFHRNGGQPIRSYDIAWHSACDRAAHEKSRDANGEEVRLLVRPQLLGRLVHDFRRSAVRNLERAGVPRSVAMKITGHLTESVYTRYAVVAEGDLNDAAAKLATLHESQSSGVLPFAKTGTGR